MLPYLLSDTTPYESKWAFLLVGNPPYPRLEGMYKPDDTGDLSTNPWSISAFLVIQLFVFGIDVERSGPSLVVAGSSLSRSRHSAGFCLPGRNRDGPSQSPPNTLSKCATTPASSTPFVGFTRAQIGSMHFTTSPGVDLATTRSPKIGRRKSQPSKFFPCRPLLLLAGGPASRAPRHRGFLSLASLRSDARRPVWRKACVRSASRNSIGSRPSSQLAGGIRGFVSRASARGRVCTGSEAHVPLSAVPLVRKIQALSPTFET